MNAFKSSTWELTPHKKIKYTGKYPKLVLKFIFNVPLYAWKESDYQDYAIWDASW
jgi:hypothetical protein